MKLSPAAKLRGFVKQPLSVKQALVEKNIQATQNNKSENIATSEVNLLKIPKPQSRLSHAQPPSLPTYNKPTAAATNTVVSTTSITTTTTKPTAQNNTESHSDKLREYLARRNDRINNTIKSTIASTTTKSVSSNQSVGSEKRPNTSRTLPTKKLPTIPHPSSTAKTSTNSFIQKVEPNHISITPKNRLHPVVTFPTISNPSKSYEKGHLDCKKKVNKSVCNEHGDMDRQNITDDQLFVGCSK